MNILDKIIAHKAKEVEENKRSAPAKLLEKSVYFSAPDFIKFSPIKNPSKPAAFNFTRVSGSEMPLSEIFFKSFTFFTKT